MKKTIIVLCLAIAAIVVMTACGNKSQSSAPAQDAQGGQNISNETTPAPADTPAPTETAPTEAAPTDTPAPTEAAPASGEITEDQAKAIALQAAGFSEADVTLTKLHKDFDDGIWKYEVEFIQGELEYSYDISLDGIIMESDIDSIYD